MKKGLAAVLALLVGSVGAYALGTVAGTEVKNTATLSYTAGGVQQPDVNSTEDTFVVDHKVDMVLVTTDTDQIEVTPGQQDQVTHFYFENEGNADQNFTFTVYNLPNGEVADYDDDADTDDVDNLEISCDGGTTWAATLTIEVPMDGNLTCDVRADIRDAANGGEDGDIMNIELNATAVDGDGNKLVEDTDGDDPTQVEIVFADGESVQNGATSGLGETGGDAEDTAGDGADLARSGYIISTPVLSVKKISCVIDDPVNGTTNPKRIPGATIRYLFDIENNGTAAVNDLNLTDTFNDALDLGGTVDSAEKSENISNPPCVCTDSGDSISGDTTVNGQDLLIEHINVDKAGDDPTHTCVWVEVEVK